MENIKKVKKNFDDYIETIDQLINVGSYTGDIVLIMLKNLKKQNEENKAFKLYKDKLDVVIGQVETIEDHKLLKEKYKIIHKHALVLIVSNFESFMNSLFRTLIDGYSDKIKWSDSKKVKIDLSLLKYSAPSVGDLVVKSLKGEINFQDLQSTKRFLKEYLEVDIKLQKNLEEKIIFYQALRHIIIHNSGVVDSGFLKQIRHTSFANQYKNEEEAEINEQTYNDAKNAFSNFAKKIIDGIIKL